MSEFNLDEISHLAQLARLELSDSEKEQFSQQLPTIIEYVERLQTMKISDDLPEGSRVDLDSLRSDEISQNPDKLTLEQLKQLAPKWDKETNQLEVPAVFGESGNE